MHDPRDIHTVKLVRAEFARHMLDTSRCDIQCRQGVVIIRGPVGRLASHNEIDPQHELSILCNALRQRPEVRDVVIAA